MPDVLENLELAIEAGEPIDWGRLAMLQAIEVLKLNRDFVRDHLERQRQADGDTSGRGGAE